MHVKKYRKDVRRMVNRGVLLLVALSMTLVSMPIMGAEPVFAIPPDPIDPEPIGGEEPYAPPDNGFSWSVPSRFGNMVNGMVDYHWIPDSLNPYVPGHYDPAYVHPTSFPVNLNGCRTQDDAIDGTSPMTYTWTFNGETQTNHNCYFQVSFPAQGTYPVSLVITQTDGTVLLDSQGRGNPFTQDILVKDILIISLGDSYGSGEGSPDVSQVLGNNDPFGNPTAVISPARWQDARCHRSAFAAPAQAARMIEAADPHTSVTFLSFACSGATINRSYYEDASHFDPYRSPEASGWTKLKGSGVLGSYSGIVPPNGDRPQDNHIPSQIDQLAAALTIGGAARQVDALLISGGGNDIGFSIVASLCTMYYDCTNYEVTDLTFRGPVPLTTRIQQDLGVMPLRYAALASAIQNIQPAVREVYITQYPDQTRNDQGGFCGEMLEDVIPAWMQPLLALLSVFDGGPYPPLPPYRMDNSELGWAGGIVLPALNAAVGTAAQTHGWTLVDGIRDSSANLFSGHGYCASDNWIRRASEAVDMQGPWAPWNALGLPVSTETTGTLHPTARGYQAIAERIFAKLAPDVLPPPPSSGQPPAPTFTSSNTGSIVGAHGWLTGHTADRTCPSGAANCAFAQAVVSIGAGSMLRGATLLINGTRAACTSSGVTVNGVLCQAALTNAQTYSWSFTFANDGIYRLEFTVSARNGTVSKLSREVKVDLNNPTATNALSAPTPASGWHRTPVTATLMGLDGNGSGIEDIQYQLGGTTTVASGSNIPLRLDTDGIHTLAFQVTDVAGRTSASQSLTVKVDQTAPASSATVSPAANAAGWNTSDTVVTLSATDNGGSGLQSYTYSASGAQQIASTKVNGATPTSLTINTEGVTTIRFAATDAAGNVEGTQTVVVKLDKTSPVVQCGAADGLWHASDVSIACNASDGGSGLADATDASFALSTDVPAGSETANAWTGSRTVCDVAGNCAPQAGPIGGNKVDKKGPDITLTTPISTVYLLNQVVPASYACADYGSGLAPDSGNRGLAACTGTAANGGAIDTASPGSKTFTVNASDNTGNASSQSTGYKVSYPICVLFDQSRSYRLGSTVPIKLQLCDAAGANVSAAGIVVNATGLTQVDGSASGEVSDPGNANPDSNFRFDATLNGYVYNLSTKGLAVGTWQLHFTVAGDPISHSVRFDLR